MIPPLAVTAGEPGGIGPELVIEVAATQGSADWVAVGDVGLFQRCVQRSAHTLKICPWSPSGSSFGDDTLTVIPVAMACQEQPGVANPAHAPYVIECLETAVDGCLRGSLSGLVTGPLNKGSVIDGGFSGFTGHTEFLAERCGVPQVVMMLTAGTLRVALATTHLPLREVADALTEQSLETTIAILLADLQRNFGCPEPRLLVTGLNPHAGEGGHLGREEIEVIEPVCERFRSRGARVTGPLPADTAFTPRWLEQTDAVLAMYHDQGLPTLKYAGFGEAINVTLGLPIVRTSVDHGTALDIAGQGIADPGSLLAALNLAREMTRTVASGGPRAS